MQPLTTRLDKKQCCIKRQAQRQLTQPEYGQSMLEYAASKGFIEIGSALISELYRCPTRGGHLFVHTNGCQAIAVLNF